MFARARYRVILALFLLGSAAVSAQSAPVGLYNEANELYRQGEFDAARDRYQAVAQSGRRDSRLFYNLGNACFKAERLGEAILWYERALRLDPRDADIRANLLFANRVKRDRDPDLPGNPVWRFFVSAFFYPTLNELSVVFSVSLLLACTVAAWRLWARERAGVSRLALLLTCASLTLFSGAFLGVRVYRQGDVIEAVVTAAEGVARSAPERAQTVVFTLHEGTKVRIERREHDWLLIRLANGLGGGLPATVVAQI